MITFVDWQHSGKPNHKHMRDRGAWGDLNQNRSRLKLDGQIDIKELEAYWTGKLAFQIMWDCYARNMPSILLGDGWYANRARRASAYVPRREKAVLLALHFNALTGGLTKKSGDYGSVFYDYRSGEHNGPRLAGLLCQRLGRALPEVKRFKRIRATSKDWTRNAFSTIRGAPGNIIALCVEPAFIDQEDHRNVFTDSGIERMSEAIVTAIQEFHNTRS
tara:strand:- start:15 stop:668 length:654 start_codon:yes stop_codon:yes gene_type:complete